MNLKKIIALFTVILILCLSGCNKLSEDTSSSTVPVPETENEAADSISLLYSASDTFNPYTCETDLNRELCRLVFDSLIRLNNSFETEYMLADTVTVKGKTCTVTLKDIHFTDGTAVTAKP